MLNRWVSAGYGLADRLEEEVGSQELLEVPDLKSRTWKPKHQRAVQRLPRAGVAEQAQAGFASRGVSPAAP